MLFQIDEFDVKSPSMHSAQIGNSRIEAQHWKNLNVVELNPHPQKLYHRPNVNQFTSFYSRLPHYQCVRSRECLVNVLVRCMRKPIPLTSGAEKKKKTYLNCSLSRCFTSMCSNEERFT